MKPLNKILKSPQSVYRWCVAIFFILFFIVPFIKPSKTGDDEMFVRLSLYVLMAFAGVMIFFSILTTIVYWEWFLANWYINVIVLVLAAFLFVGIYYWNPMQIDFSI
jgi:UDP-N-acetylmuramyl pentapeptide phosphotransferase/UDP-N-acetylglucosamine-1-phosphate transferase